jgi:hypothetical protein
MNSQEENSELLPNALSSSHSMIPLLTAAQKACTTYLKKTKN